MVWLLRLFGPLILVLLAPSPLRAQQTSDARQMRTTADIVLKGQVGLKGTTFSPDSKLIATISEDHTVRLWQVATGAEHAVLKHTSVVASVAFSPDSSLVVTASEDRMAHLWETPTGRERVVLSGHPGFVRTAAFSPDGKLIATGSEDNTARLWDVATGTERTVLKHMGAVRVVAFSSDGTLLYTTSYQSARLWDVATGTERAVLKGIFPTAVSPDRTLVITAWPSHMVRLWELATGTERVVLKGHLGPVTHAEFSPDGKLVVTASRNDGTVRLWDATTGAERALLGVHTSIGPVLGPDGKLVVTAFGDRIDPRSGLQRMDTVRLWEVATGAERAVLKHTAVVTSVAFSPDNKFVLTVSKDSTGQLWSIVP
jgi:WD40 repeat protein